MPINRKDSVSARKLALLIWAFTNPFSLGHSQSIVPQSESGTTLEISLPKDQIFESVRTSKNLENWSALTPDQYEQSNQKIRIRIDESSSSQFMQIQNFGDAASEFSLIPPGSFMMGSPESELGRSDNETLHEVTISKPFYMGRKEITRGEFNAAMDWAADEGLVDSTRHGYWLGDYQLSYVYVPGFKSIGNLYCDDEDSVLCDDLPMAYAFWYGAIAYANVRSIMEGKEPCYDLSDWSCDFSKSGYRLPTEAEWEYACRADTDTAFYAGDIVELSAEALDPNLDKAGWYFANTEFAIWYQKGFRLGGTKQPNSFGLFDMHGNVAEWCWDRFGDYDIHANLDPRGPIEGSTRVIRGGGAGLAAEFCRSAYRGWFDIGHGKQNQRYGGFRLLIRPSPIARGSSTPVEDTDGDGFEQVILDGSPSESLDGEIQSWHWSWEDGSVSGEMAEAEFPLGRTDILLTITSDNGETDTDQFVVEVKSIANAGSDIVLTDIDVDGRQTVTLDGTESSSNVDIVSWNWTWQGGSGSGRTVTTEFPVGETEVTLAVRTSQGIVGEDGLIVKVESGSEGFSLIPSGSFVMGESDNVRNVTISESFYMSSTEVTHRQFAEVYSWAYEQGFLDLNENYVSYHENASAGILLRKYYFDAGGGAHRAENNIIFNSGKFYAAPGTEDLPVAPISWYGAVAYAHFLSLIQGRESCYDLNNWSEHPNEFLRIPFDASKNGFRLPTSAEWEYACRAGTTGLFHTQDDQVLRDIAWYSGNSGELKTVGTKQPNSWGLHDMHGNVLEWCWDAEGSYPEGDLVDPIIEGNWPRILRGGSSKLDLNSCRAANIISGGPNLLTGDDYNQFQGFRILFRAD